MSCAARLEKNVELESSCACRAARLLSTFPSKAWGPQAKLCCRAARLFSTFPSPLYVSLRCFNNKAWGPQAKLCSPVRLIERHAQDIRCSLSSIWNVEKANKRGTTNWITCKALIKPAKPCGMARLSHVMSHFSGAAAYHARMARRAQHFRCAQHLRCSLM